MNVQTKDKNLIKKPKYAKTWLNLKKLIYFEWNRIFCQLLINNIIIGQNID